MSEMTLVPDKFKDRDPRTLLYHFPHMPVIKYAKLMQEYTFYKLLKTAEQVAKMNGYILIPYSCMNWQRRANFAEQRKIKVNNHSFFMMKYEELTNSERKKLDQYLSELHETA